MREEKVTTDEPKTKMNYQAFGKVLFIFVIVR
jgi:hypothetical protein